jgi:exodeoxyribonuclease-3
MKVFKVATFNSNSVRARLPIVLEWLTREEPDVLFLQETKVQDKDFPASEFERIHYRAVFRGQKSYNGVCILSKEPLGEIRKDILGAGDEEARFLSAKLGQVPLINVYVPQGFAPGTEKFAYKLSWLRELLEYIKSNHEARHPLLLAGDFNVALEPMDVFDPEELRGEVGFHPEEQDLLREYLDWGFVDIFRKHQPEGGHYTFWDYRIPNGFKRKMGWRIDYIFATPSLAEKSGKAWIDTRPRTLQKPSDHTFLVAEFDIEP